MGPEDLENPSTAVYRPRQTLCNEDCLSDSSDSSLTVTSPVISDDDGPVQDLDESESESDDEWDSELEGDPNQGQNLQFQLQAAAAGIDIFPALRKNPG